MMTYVYIALGIYLAFGAMLTYSVVSGMHMRRFQLRDWILGPPFMPLLFLAGLVFMAFEKLWARLMRVLDLEPPEEMRPGPPTADPMRDDPA